MNEPTRAQLTVLRRLAAGDVLRKLGGPQPTWFFHARERAVDYRTVFVLLDREWIEPFKARPHQLDPCYRLTAAGRSVVRTLTKT